MASKELLFEAGPMAEKLRMDNGGGIRDPVLLRLRLCLLGNMGTVGGAAASNIESLSSMGFSGTGAGLLLLLLANGSLGYARGNLAALKDSRMGFLRILPVEAGEAFVCACGIGGRFAISSRPMEEWLRKERAVSQT